MKDLYAENKFVNSQSRKTKSNEIVKPKTNFK